MLDKLKELPIRLQYIDRRILYLSLVIAVAIPMFVPMKLPIHVFEDTKGLYDTIEQTPKDKIVLIMSDWGPGSKAENWPQTEAVIHHLLKRGIKFAIMGFDPQGPKFSQAMAEEIAERYNREYGRDWVNFGYKPGSGALILAFVKDIPQIVKRDIFGTEIRKVPMMKEIKDIRSVYLVYEVAAGPGILDWIGLVQPTYKTKLGFGCTAVCAPEAYPYLDSGQLSGMLVGMRGAAEYEKLVQAPAMATEAMPLQSMAHFLIIFLVFVGNIGYFLARQKAVSERRR